MRDMFEEVTFGHVSKRWWVGLLIAVGMAFTTELIVVWIRAFLLMFSALIWGTVDYEPSIDVMLVSQLLAYGGVFAAVALWTLIIEYRSPASLGYFREKAFSELALGWLIGLGVISLVCFLPSVWSDVIVIGPITDYSPLLFLVYFIAYHTFVMGRVLIFQGYLLPFWARFNRPLALLSSSLLALGNAWLKFPEASLIWLINTFLFNLLSGILVLWRGNLWLATGGQAIWSVTIYHLYAPLGVKWASLYQVSQVDNLTRELGISVSESIWLTLVLIGLSAYLAWAKVSWRKS